MGTNNKLRIKAIMGKWAIVPLLMATLLSCNDFFVKEDFTIIEIQNKDDLDAAVGGVKDLLAFFMLNDTWFYEAKYFGDDIRKSGTYYYYYNKKSKVGNSPEDGDINIEEIYWKNLYQIIISVNNVMNQYDRGSLSFVGEKQPIGEILFIRAYCYYLLVRLYGGVPIVKNTDIDEKLSKGTYDEIYSFIETDLNRAYGMVTRSKNTNALLTIDQACVKSLLAEVYLSWAGYPAKEASKYADAAKTAKGLLDSAAYFNLAFTEQFDQLWVNGLNNTGEDVFCYYTNNNDICQKQKIPYPIYVNSEKGNSFYSNDKVGYSGYLCATEGAFYNQFPKGYRKDQTFFTTIYVPYDPTIIRDTGLFYIDHIVDMFNAMGELEDWVRPKYRKFYIDTTIHEQSKYGEVYWSPKINFLRLTHTVLTYAEAQARTGMVTPEAYEWINKIRRRANNVPVNAPSEYDLPTGISPTAFADSVVLERAWELAGEFEGRWFDLLRLEKIEEMMNSQMETDKWIKDMQPNSRGEYFYEIPEYDKLINENLK